MAKHVEKRINEIIATLLAAHIPLLIAADAKSFVAVWLVSLLVAFAGASYAWNRLHEARCLSSGLRMSAVAAGWFLIPAMFSLLFLPIALVMGVQQMIAYVNGSLKAAQFAWNAGLFSAWVLLLTAVCYWLWWMDRRLTRLDEERELT